MNASQRNRVGVGMNRLFQIRVIHVCQGFGVKRFEWSNELDAVSFIMFIMAQVLSTLVARSGARDRDR